MVMILLVILRKVVDNNFFGFFSLLLNSLYWQSLVEIGGIACATLAVDSFLILTQGLNLHEKLIPLLFSFTSRNATSQ